VKRILFVDDDSNILDGIRRLLHADRKRWDMQFAIGGEAALQACEAGKFDVVISDMRMPGMDGATLLGLIRDRYPSTARLILSGYAEEKLATRAVGVAYRVLSKPCSGPELQATIERVCTLQDIFCTPEIRRIIETIGQLPSLSKTYEALTRAVHDPAASMENVADIIEQDVAMSAKVLQIVNSGFFGLAQRVTSLQSAVSFLGMDTIQNLALASDTFRVFVPDPRIPKTFCETMQQSGRRVALSPARFRWTKPFAALPSWPHCSMMSESLYWQAKCLMSFVLHCRLCWSAAAGKLKPKSNYLESRTPR